MKKRIKTIANVMIIITITFLIIAVSYVAISIHLSEDVEHTGIITMKWDIPKLLTTHYYFEIDNETKINVYSYTYHKYDIGDIYTWWD